MYPCVIVWDLGRLFIRKQKLSCKLDSLQWMQLLTKAINV